MIIYPPSGTWGSGGFFTQPAQDDFGYPRIYRVEVTLVELSRECHACSLRFEQPDTFKCPRCGLGQAHKEVVTTRFGATTSSEYGCTGIEFRDYRTERVVPAEQPAGRLGHVLVEAVTE